MPFASPENLFVASLRRVSRQTDEGRLTLFDASEAPIPLFVFHHDLGVD
jgi:hypothetical protein